MAQPQSEPDSGGDLKQLRDGLLRFCMRLTEGDRDEAEDLAQHALLTALVSKEEELEEEPEELFNWLCTVAKHEFLDRCGSAGRSEVSLEDLPEPAVPEEYSTTGADLLRLAQRLPPQQRRVVWLHCIEGWSLKEVAARLDLSDSTARVHFHKAKRKLRKWYASAGPDEESEKSQEGE